MSGLTEWSIDGYTVRLLRQDELEGGLVLHFVVDKPVAVEKKGFGFKPGGKDRKTAKPIQRGEAQPYTADQAQKTQEGGLLIKYSRRDPITGEVIVGVYVGDVPEKGVSAEEYNQRAKKVFYEAARLAVQESKRLGLN